MAGSNDDIKQPRNATRSRSQGRNKLTSNGRLGSNIVPIDVVDSELLDALKKVGDDILAEPTPERLLDALRDKKPRP